MSNHYHLHTSSSLHPEQNHDDGENNQAIPSQISLKINNQLMNLLENDENEMEIEFTSLTEGKIYCGGQEFSVRFAENQATEIYRRRDSSSSSGSGSSDEAGNDFEFVGIAEKRYTVKSSYEVVSQDIRQKTKGEQEAKEQHRSHFMTKIDTSRAVQTVNVGLSSSSSSSSSGITGKKRSGASSDTHLASSPDRKAPTTATQPTPHDTNDEPRWIVIRDLPKSTTASDIRTFLSGLKVFDIFACVNMAGDGKDVYVQFEKQAGADMGVVRNGETIVIAAERKRTSQSSRPRTANTTSNDDTDGCSKFSAHIYRTHHEEASWAKALCVRLDDTVIKCQETLSILNDYLPSNLLSQHPRLALSRWGDVLKGCVLPTPDEIVSYDEHHRLRDHTSIVYRYDYTPVKGFYDSYVDQSWGGGYVNQLFDASLPGLHTEAQLHLSSVTNAPTDPSYGNVSLHSDYEEITTILNKLSSVLSTSLILPFTGEVSEKQRKAQGIVCDHVHRMIGIYQRIHHFLWTKRYAYSQKLV